MKIGCCCSIDNIDLLVKTGYDYIEPNLFQIYSMSDDDFNKAKIKIEASPIKCEAFYCFLPGGLKVVGETYDYNRNLNYVEKAICRASQLGCYVIVIGSGGARRIPDSFSTEKVQEQFVEFLRMVSDVAKEYNITITIEPLRKEETNFINYVTEARQMAKIVDRENIKILADLYHFYDGNEDLSHLVECADLLYHIHIANPVGRLYPTLLDEYKYDQFFSKLKEIGYDNRISIEANTKNMLEDLERSMELFKFYL
jgi:D-psicose/D-tagatose/L-ribulose 3-epimerase